MKKLLAILCTVALLLTSLFTGMAVAAEDTATELTQLAPSNYNFDGKSIPTYSGNAGSSAFVNAEFNAMVLPLSTTSTPFFQFGGQWSGLRFVINSNEVVIYYLSGTQENKTLYPLTENYNEKAAYKITITAEMVNAGTAIADGEEFDATKHEHMSYDVYLDDNLVVENHIISSANITGYSNVTTGKWMRLQYCTVYDVTTFENAFAATDADAASDLDKLTTLTPADFNMPYGAHYSAAYTQTSKETVNTVFETNIMFEYGGKLVYPRSIGWPGIQIGATNGTKLAISDFSLGSGWETTVIEPATVNAGSLVGNMLNLKIVFEVGDFDGNNIMDGNTVATVLEDDVRLTYYINDIQVYQNFSYADYDYDENENPIIGTQKAKTGTLLFSEASGTLFNMVHAERVVLEDPNVEVPVMLENAATSGGLVVGKLNTVDVTLAEGDSIAMGYYGNLAVTEGALVYTDKNGTATTVATDMAGVKFNLKTLAERIDLDGNGYATEVKARVWINNKATSAYQYLVGTLPVDQAITLSGTAALSAASQVPTDLREYSLADVGIADVDAKDIKLNGWSVHNVPVAGGSIINTMFQAKVNVTDLTVCEGSTISPLFLMSYGGFKIEHYFTKTATSYRRIVYTPGETKESWSSGTLPAIGTEYVWQVAVQQTNRDLNGDGVNNDIRVGFFINGQLFTGKFFVSNNVDAVYATTPYLEVYYIASKVEDTNGADNSFSYTVKNIDTTDDLADYEEIGIEDVGFENGTYKTSVDSDKTAYGDGAQVAKTINNTVLKTKVKWVRAEGATGALDMVLTYAGGASWGNSINFGMGADDIGTVTIANSYTYKLPDLTEGEEHELMVSTKMVDGGWKYGVYVDGNLQNNRYYYWLNKGDDWRTVLMGVRSLYGNAASELTVGGDNFTVGETIDSSYTVAADTDTKTYTVNGDAVGDTARVLDTVGEYEITCTSKMIYDTTGIVDQTGTKTVVIYKENDLNADNEVNILDFIAAQKSAADTDGTYDLGKVGAYAAGIAVGEKCTAKEIVAIKIALLFAL